MLGKNKRAYDTDNVPAAQRLKANVVDLYASNQISAARSQELINDAADSGIFTFKHLQSKGARMGRNIARPSSPHMRITYMCSQA